MSVFQSPRFLRNVMLLDAASCAGCGLLQVALTEPMAALLHLPAALLGLTGAFLLVYAAAAAFVGTRMPVPRGIVTVFAFGNLAWAAGCVGLLALGGFAPTALGIAYVLVQLVTVVALAELQLMGVKRSPQHGWA